MECRPDPAQVGPCLGTGCGGAWLWAGLPEWCAVVGHGGGAAAASWDATGRPARAAPRAAGRRLVGGGACPRGSQLLSIVEVRSGVVKRFRRSLHERATGLRRTGCAARITR